MVIDCCEREIGEPKFFDELIKAQIYLFELFCDACKHVDEKVWELEIHDQDELEDAVESLADADVFDDENDYKAYERMHGSHSYRSPEYEHRMGRERGYDYGARSYQYPYSRYDREELDRDSKRYREDDRERMEREREMRDRGLRSTRETRNTSVRYF